MKLRLFALGLLLSIGSFAQAAHSVTLAWTWAQSSGPAATGFNIYRATSPTGTFSIVGSTAASVFAYADTSAPVQTSGSSFYYYVTAFNATSESTPSNTVGPETIPFVLAPPAGLAATVK